MVSLARPFRPTAPMPSGGFGSPGRRAQLIYRYNAAGSERRLRISWAEFTVPSIIPPTVEGPFIGAQPGQPAPRRRQGQGITQGPHGDFWGEQPLGNDPTFVGFTKKRPPLGEGTILDQLEEK